MDDKEKEDVRKWLPSAKSGAKLQLPDKHIGERIVVKVKREVRKL